MKENTEVHKQETTHSLIKIKILLAYLEKILYLWAVGVRDKRKNSLLERDEHRTPTLRNTAEKTGHLCWMTSNPMNDVNAGYYPAECEENRNAGLTTRALDKEDPDKIRGNGHTL